MRDIPNVQRVGSSLSSLPSKTIDLIHWVLDSKSFTLTALDKAQFAEIQKMTGHTTEVPSPNFIFEVTPSETNDAKFQLVRNNRKVFFAYHGSRIENFHSILHNGLASHMNKVSMFGEGTYLSGELAVSMTYSPTGLTWDSSELGDKLGCVAVCEMIDDSSVKCQEKTGSEDGVKKSRARVAGSMAGDVPEKYYVVRNNEVMRVRYLLVYAEKTKPKQLGVSRGHMTWFQQNKFLVMMSVYVLLLLAIGLANSKSLQYQLKRIFR
ncbi:protein mono-ADP-ribosyltransferase PARP16-like [Haliotis rubra]|uniref:protein mono-ADP-ribosyltransferase PARP16-like n=1 Tax=Haliotis rubra TaxID=36100 RepID=UPI001EE612E3|nr:protein mono-ADP-ribosyltransferase PARP16-like [Haliotis rubra]XP_046549874.1 protein mono-ADP-ribosyltransferase PARP16-like [Haliotis rubra]XP_046549875.1 protein mono-ADP-ribosyltransferase PARP16-like [Haliotis rubra]XP_046549876.1 protein mono-ADP-ribosyltransferase PARP16-like [Haliotis rubra]